MVLDELEKLWEKGKYDDYFYFLDKGYRLDEMLERWADIPKNRKYEVFCIVYSLIESGFDEIPDYIFDEVCQLRPDLPDEVLRKLQEGVIYRGGKVGGRIPEDSTSWSLLREKAEWFANRFANPKTRIPVLWQGRVNPSDVVAYIDERKEQEVVVKRGTVRNISRVDIK